MAIRRHRIISDEESEIYDDPHIDASRVIVRDVYAPAEQRGLSPGLVAERYTLDGADVYEAPEYYHNKPV